MPFIEKLFLNELRTTARILLFFFIAISVIVFIIHGIMVVAFNHPLDYGEGPLLNQALRVTRGQALYPAEISEAPFLISNYPPVYILVNAFFASIFSPSLWHGRLISLLSTMGVAILLGLIVQHLSGKPSLLPGFIAGGTFLAIPYVVGWSALFRIDMLALFFSIAGLTIILKDYEKNTYLALAVGSFVLAAFTRQTMGLAGPLAALIWIWLGNKKQAIKFVLGYAISGLVIFGVLNIITQGGFFFHIVTANVNPFRWETVAHHAREILNNLPILLGLALVFLAAGWRFSKAYPILVPHLLASALTAVTIGKVGSNVNYLVEFSASLALAAGFTFAGARHLFGVSPEEQTGLTCPKEEIPEKETISREVRWKLWANLGITLILSTLLVIQIANLTNNSLFTRISSHRDRIKPKQEYVFLEETVKRAAEDGPVLADEFMALLPDNGIPLYLQPFEFVQLANAGLWDQTPLITAIEEKEFPLILLHHFQHYPVYLERWTPEMLDSIFDNYVATEMKAETLLFEPKTPDQVYPEGGSCPATPWRLPTTAPMGLYWWDGQILMLGHGKTGAPPVYAIADGTLYQFPGWDTAVAIQHKDPLNPNRVIWSFYGDMAAGFDPGNSYLMQHDSGEGIPVMAGDLIGYQGRWLGPDQQTWVHLRFTLLPGNPEGSFPQELLDIHDPFADLPSFSEQQKLGLEAPISLTTYTGLPESDLFGTLDFMPFICETRE
jgi:hypothetical protein